MATDPIWPRVNADGTFVSPKVQAAIDARANTAVAPLQSQVDTLSAQVDSTVVDAKAYTDGKVDGLATTAAVQAGDQSSLTDAKAYTDSRVTPLATAASVTAGDQQSLTDAKAYTDGKVGGLRDEVEALGIDARLDALESRPTSDVDLAGYATEEYVDAKVAAIPAPAPSSLLKDPDTGDYYVDTSVAAPPPSPLLIDPDTGDYYTEA